MSETAPRQAIVTGTDALVAAVTVALEEIQISRRVVRRALDAGTLDVIALREHDARLFDLAADLRGGVKLALVGDVLASHPAPILEAVPGEPGRPGPTAAPGGTACPAPAPPVTGSPPCGQSRESPPPRPW